MESKIEFVIGDKYLMDSGLGGSFSIVLTDIIYDNYGINNHIFRVTNRGFEEVDIKIPFDKLNDIVKKR